MSDDQDKGYYCLIPANVNTRYEPIPGIGIPDLCIIGAYLIVSLLITMIGLRSFGCFILFSCIPTAGIMFLLMRDDSGFAVHQQIRLSIEFSKVQRRYLYVAKSGDKE